MRKHPNAYCIGENRWPDCEDKFKISGFKKHFIGPLQSNKVRKVVLLADCIQSVDSEKLIKKIDQTAADFDKEIKIYLQINISKDPKKQGFTPEEAKKILLEADYQNVKITGLMTIGALTNMDARRAYFRKMKQVFDHLKQIHPPLETLSMGMSQDYQIAIEEGATMVRLGKILQES